MAAENIYMYTNIKHIAREMPVICYNGNYFKRMMPNPRNVTLRPSARAGILPGQLRAVWTGKKTRFDQP